MLTDPTKSPAFRESSHWRSPLLDFRLRVKQETPLGLGATDGPKWRSNSFSGHERNRLLLGGADGFSDVSLVSGVDCREDARSFAMLDYDADGWLDLAVMSTNAPRFRFFRNRMGDLGRGGGGGGGGNGGNGGRGGRVLMVTLEGGNRTAEASALSPREAVGAVVTAVTSAGRRAFRRSAGEGLASQNMAAVRITLAPGESLQEVNVRWPSGRVTGHRPKATESAVVIREVEP